MRIIIDGLKVTVYDENGKEVSFTVEENAVVVTTADVDMTWDETIQMWRIRLPYVDVGG